MAQLLTATLDEPVTVDASAIPKSVQLEQVVSGQIAFADQRPPIRGKARFTYTKTEDSATLESEFGTVAGVQVFEGSGTLLEGEGWDRLELFKGQSIPGKVFFHPTLGILKIEMPAWPLGVAMTGQHDCGDPVTTDYNTIQKVGVVLTEQPTFVLSSYDCSGTFDADIVRHAQMLVELRWADRNKAATLNEQPQVEVSFQTVWGWFPHEFLSSPVSIFHPEENGQGFTYWYALRGPGSQEQAWRRRDPGQRRRQVPGFQDEPGARAGARPVSVYGP